MVLGARGRGGVRDGQGYGDKGGYDLEANSDDEALDADLAALMVIGGDEFLAQLTADFGLSLANAILVILRGFDSWHEAVRAEPETDDQPGREALALR
eukprot:4040311-Pleurochrysis_carterae.AAC.1